MGDALQLTDLRTHVAERRMHARRTIRTIAYVEIDEGNGGIVLNASEGGVSVHAVVGLMEEKLPQMRIQLPHPHNWVKVGARVVWASKSRKIAGLEFTDLPEDVRAQIREWLAGVALPQPIPIDVHVEAETVFSPSPEHSADALDTTLKLSETVMPASEVPSRETVTDAVDLALSLEAEISESAEVATALPPPIAEVPPSQTLAAAGAAAETVQVPSRRSSVGTVSLPRAGDLSLTKWQHPMPAKVGRQPSRRAWIVALVGFVATASLAAGWAAGRGAFDPVLAGLRAIRTHAAPITPEVTIPPTNPDTAAAESPAVETLGGAPVAQAPHVAPIVAPAAPATVPQSQPRQRISTSANDVAKPIKPRVAWQPHNLAPAIRRVRADYSGPDANDAAPTIADFPISSEGLPEDSPIGARSPAPPPVRQAAVLKPAELVRRVDAVYPEIALQQRVHGTVVLKIKIKTDGTVREARVVSGSAMLASAAVSAVRQWRYNPARLDGNPIEVENQINVEFRLP